MPRGTSTVHLTRLVVALASSFVATSAVAEFPRVFRGLTSPFRAAHRDAPPLPEPVELEEPGVTVMVAVSEAELPALLVSVTLKM